MWITILEFLKTVNDHYANLILLIIAIISAIVAYREYSSRHRPYVVPEIVFEKQNSNWYFYVMLLNKGEFPATDVLYYSLPEPTYSQHECDAKGIEVYNFVYERYRDAKDTVYA